KTEGLEVEFAEDAIARLAEIAWQVNEKTENIGARRLHTVLERLLEELSFSAGGLASKQEGKPLVIDAACGNQHLGELAVKEDLSGYGPCGEWSRSAMGSAVPAGIELRKAARPVDLEYADGPRVSLPAEFLRVHSPSAGVQGHGQQLLQPGKQNV